MTPYSSNRSEAFTLVEVLVALTVFAFGLVGVVQALRTAGHAARHVEDLQRAALLAERHLVTFMIEPTLEVGEERGQFPTPDQRFGWERITRTTPHERLAEVHITVRWREQGREQAYVLRTLREQTPFGAEGR